MPLITRPTGMTFSDWGIQVFNELEKFGLFNMHPADDWKQWALSAVQLPYIAARNPPNPMGYENWLEWAELFVRSIE